MGGKRITDEQKKQMRALRSQGMSIKDISELMGISAYGIKTYTSDIVVNQAKKSPILDDDEKISDVAGYEGLYCVTSKGRVFSMKSNAKPHAIKQLTSKKAGYKVPLIKDGKSKLHRVDLLVADAFCVNELGDDAVLMHMDGDMCNNDAANLAWVKPSGRQEVKIGRPHLLSEKDVEEVRRRWLAGESIGVIAKELGVSYSTAYKQIDGLLRDIPEPPCEPGEEWVELPGYDGRYCVSSYGRIYSTGLGRREPRIMLPHTNHNDYKTVWLTDVNDETRKVFVHRIVASVFCDGYDESHNLVNHKDGDVTNNRADNLEWCTPQENTRHAIDVLGVEMGGSKPFNTRTVREIVQEPVKPSPLRRFTDEEVVSIRKDPRSARQLAKEYGVNKCTIINIRRGLTYRDVQ